MFQIFRSQDFCPPAFLLNYIAPAFHVNYSINRQNTRFQPENIRVLEGLVFTHWVKENTVESANFHPPRMLKLEEIKTIV
jgi:hypothetical protein